MENMHLCNYKHLFTHTNDKTPQLLYQNLSTVIYRQLLSKPIFSALTELFIHFPNFLGETGGKFLLAQAFVHLWELLGFCELPTIRPYWTALPPPSFSCFSPALQILWSSSVCTGGQTQDQALWFSQCEHGQCHNCGDEKSFAQKSWAVKIGGPWSIVSLVNVIYSAECNKVQDCCFMIFELHIQFNCKSYVSKLWNFFYSFFETKTMYWGSQFSISHKYLLITVICSVALHKCPVSFPPFQLLINDNSNAVVWVLQHKFAWIHYLSLSSF